MMDGSLGIVPDVPMGELVTVVARHAKPELIEFGVGELPIATNGIDPRTQPRLAEPARDQGAEERLGKHRLPARRAVGGVYNPAVQHVDRVNRE